MLVKRKSCEAGEQTEFTFQQDGCQFLVKNFTESDIYVTLDKIFSKDKAIKIPTMAYQIIASKYDKKDLMTKKIIVLADEIGEVEVQMILW